ncbi:MAG TPA: branched-chain amino acid ABC transporter permease [Pseudorhodoplanes sp.]|nr:branched-chain amino acid ABC transporter permease [Pseudorhodoplanes sp.]
MTNAVQTGRPTLLRTKRQGSLAAAAGWVVVAVLVIAFPALHNVYFLYLATLVAINVIGATGLNLTVGYAGILSIGHSAFMGVGAYVGALMMLYLGTPLLLNIVVGALAAFLVGLVFAIPALRIKGVFLAVATLAAQFMLYFIFRQWGAVTGGDRGLTLPVTNIFGLGDVGFYYFTVLVAALLCLFCRNLFRTRVGRAFIAVRERDYAATVLGIDVVRTKLLAFGLGAAYAGVAGVLNSMYLRVVNPEQFTLTVSIFFLAAIIVGGRASILGSILGAAFMTLMPEALRLLLDAGGAATGRDLIAVTSPLRELVFGVMIVAFLMFEPRGLMGFYERLRGRAEVLGAEAEVH